MKKVKVYTRTGDRGDTGLLYGGRVPKSDPRVEAYGTIDEAVSALGLGRALCAQQNVKDIIHALQRELFTVGGEMATADEKYDTFVQHFGGVTKAMVDKLEATIAELEREVEMPRVFIMPGDTAASGALDLARAIIRRAERRAVSLQEAGLTRNPEIVRYLNRLSSLVYLLARYEDMKAGATLPRKGATKATAL
ncbi:MAG: cob(I)yrinic acid a,c-diamide adenosyltransferase [Dehalococcoidia bacterium]|nr:cob(I)yrinic acid a,c-diamide adenosyltransferase [Dehalococcoidia bacterium]